jgi:hypothetical protein
LEVRVFVLEAGAQGLQVAYCTNLKEPERDRVGAAKFDLGTVDARGRVRLASGAVPAIRPDGPPQLECPGFVELPDRQSEWTDDTAQPPILWRALGTELVNGMRCTKIQAVQQTPEWERPTTDQATWKRTETRWLAHTTGVVVRVERDQEWRRVGRRSEVQSRTIYDLNGGITTYPDPLGADRRREIQQAARFQDELRKLRKRRGQLADYERLKAAIDAHLEWAPATPFRVVIQDLRRGAEAGQRGEPPPPDGP